MSLREHIVEGNLNHAYLIEGEREAVLAELLPVLRERGVVFEANPDVHTYSHDVFLIDHAHELRREQSMHAAEGSRKIFIVSFNTMTSEAQNALLKTLEEPTAGTHFFFITRTGEILLPTVRSRMQIIKNETTKDVHNEKEKSLGEQFLHAPLSERLKMIEKYTKAKDEKKAAAKDDARKFLASLERAMYAQLKQQPSEKFGSSLEDVLTAKRYLSDRSPSVKILLEHLALTVPKVSR